MRLTSLILFLAVLVAAARADVLVGCTDIYQDIPDCLLYLLDADHSGAISYTEWTTGAETLPFGTDVMAQVNATTLFDACDYTGDYQLGMDDWTNRSWPCVLSNMHVLMVCYLCQQNGWTPGMKR
jgi:hypothetical protein